MSRQKRLRYIATGPGLDLEPSYAEDGPAMSRALTAALASEEDGTWYWRDAIGDHILGHVERSGKNVFVRVSGRG